MAEEYNEVKNFGIRYWKGKHNNMEIDVILDPHHLQICLNIHSTTQKIMTN